MSKCHSAAETGKLLAVNINRLSRSHTSLSNLPLKKKTTKCTTGLYEAGGGNIHTTGLYKDDQLPCLMQFISSEWWTQSSPVVADMWTPTHRVPLLWMPSYPATGGRDNCLQSLCFKKWIQLLPWRTPALNFHPVFWDSLFRKVVAIAATKFISK